MAQKNFDGKDLTKLTLTITDWSRALKIDQRKYHRVHQHLLIDSPDGKRRVGEERDGRFYMTYIEAQFVKEKFDAVTMGAPRKNKR